MRLASLGHITERMLKIMFTRRTLTTLIITTIALVAVIGLSVWTVSAQGPGGNGRNQNGTPMPCDGTGPGMVNGGMGMQHQHGQHGDMMGNMHGKGNQMGMMGNMGNCEDCSMTQNSQTSRGMWGTMRQMQHRLHDPANCPYAPTTIQ